MLKFNARKDDAVLACWRGRGAASLVEGAHGGQQVWRTALQLVRSLADWPGATWWTAGRASGRRWSSAGRSCLSGTALSCSQHWSRSIRYQATAFFSRHHLNCGAQLVCDWAGLRSIYNAVYMLGLLVGSYVFGWLSDRHGRVPGTALHWCNCTVLQCQP